MWVGLDDTDSLTEGCTTYVATEIIKEAIKKYDIIGYPRLVRLNPNIPWKTRGNGAIAIHLGHGYGEKKEIGYIGKKIFSYEKGKNILDKNFFEVVRKIIEKNAYMNDEKTNPAFVICRNKPSYRIYKKAVKGIVSIDEALNELKKDCIHKTYKNGRGIIGSVAAISWKPYDRTYELISYGNEKYVDEESVIKMDKECTTTFDNYDYENKHIQIMPRALPLIYGIRGEDANDLKKAMKIVKSSPVKRWLIFKTNQATDEHLQKKKIKDIKPYESVIVKGIVNEKPHVIKGGHVIFSISDGSTIDCAAYEPTKGFRKIIKELEKGDVVIVYGGVRAEPLTINIEKIKVIKLVKVYRKVENPICPVCGKHMKSMGKGKGYRCLECGTIADEKKARYEVIKRKIKPGYYEVPPVARRHLSKPLKRVFFKRNGS